MENWYTRWVKEYREGDTSRPNIDLWNQIFEEIKKLTEIGTFVELIWVKGHSNVRFNDYADKYANKGRTEGRVTETLIL